MRRSILFILLLCIVGALGCPNDSTPSISDDDDGTLDAGLDVFQPDRDDDEEMEVDAGVSEPDDDDIIPLDIFRVDPPAGPQEGGTALRIFGTGFTPQTRLYIDNQLVELVFFQSENLLTARSRPSDGLGAVSFRLEDGDQITELDNAFTYIEALDIDMVLPREGDAGGGEVVEITGEAFDESTLFLFNALPAEVISISEDGQMASVRTPRFNEIGYVDVSAVGEFDVAVRRNAYEVIGQPEVHDIRPNVLTVEGGIVDVYGSSFHPELSFDIGGETLAIETFISPERVRIQVPALDSGLYDVRMFDSATSQTLPKALNIVAQLSPLQLTPAVSDPAGGTGVCLSGLQALLNDDEMVTSLSVAGTSVELDETRLSDIRNGERDCYPITYPAENIAMGMSEVEVIFTSERVETVSYAYEPYFSVSDFSPRSIQIDDENGPTAVGIVGTNLLDATGTVVELGGTILTTSCSSSIECEATLPETLVVGQYPLHVRQGDVVVSPGILTVRQGDVTASRALPRRGSIAGGTRVQIFGEGFLSVEQVFVGPTAASFVDIESDQRMEIIVPASETSGVVDIRFIDIDGTATALADAFTYFDPSALLGGAHGGEIDGALYVTVIDEFVRLPVEDASIMLGSDAEGIRSTDSRGQVTFSDADLQGHQTITIWKDGYERETFVDLNAAELTVYLSPTVFSSGGGGGGGGGGAPVAPPPATISGHVTGFEKRFFDPAELERDENGNVIEIAVAYVDVTAPSVEGGLVPRAQSQAVLEDGGRFVIPSSRVGRVGLVAVAGLFNIERQVFTPKQMGIRRRVFPDFGVNLEDQDIELTWTLEQEVEVSLPNAPLWGLTDTLALPDALYVRPVLDLDEDGAYPLTAEYGGQDGVILRAIPDAPGELLNFYAGAYTTYTSGLRNEIGLVTTEAGTTLVVGEETIWGLEDAQGIPALLGNVMVIQGEDGVEHVSRIVDILSDTMLILSDPVPFTVTSTDFHIGVFAAPYSAVAVEGVGSLRAGLTISPILDFPRPIAPLPSAVLGRDRQILWEPASGTMPSFHELTIGDAITGEVSWRIVLSGDKNKVVLPSASSELFLPGTTYILRHASFYAPEFNFNSFSTFNTGAVAEARYDYLFIYPGDDF